MSQDEFLAQAHIIERQPIEIKPIETEGFILDIGGGGEGIIGKLNGSQVVAIDKRLYELEETENDSIKIVMDATDLQFLDASFTDVTSFFTMMYIPNDQKPKVLSEAYRVLGKGGKLRVWDAKIPEKVEDKKYFLIQLKVVMPEETVMTGYGVHMKKQDINGVKKLALEAGFTLKIDEEKEHTFYLEFEK